MARITVPCYYGNTAQQHHSTCYHDDFGASATEDKTFLLDRMIEDFLVQSQQGAFALHSPTVDQTTR